MAADGSELAAIHVSVSSAEMTGFTWWLLSVVFLSIALNLVSSYLKPPIDNALSHLSGKWKTRLSKEKEEYREFITLVRQDPVIRSAAVATVAYRTVMSIGMYLAVILLLLIWNPLTLKVSVALQSAPVFVLYAFKGAVFTFIAVTLLFAMARMFGVMRILDALQEAGGEKAAKFLD